MALDDVPPTLPMARKDPDPDGRRIDAVLAKRLATQISGRQMPGPVAIPFEDAPWWNVSLYREAYVTDASQTAVRHRVADPRTARRLIRETLEMARRFRAEGPAVAGRWADAAPRLTSRENWERLYGM